MYARLGQIRVGGVEPGQDRRRVGNLPQGSGLVNHGREEVAVLVHGQVFRDPVDHIGRVADGVQRGQLVPAHGAGRDMAIVVQRGPGPARDDRPLTASVIGLLVVRREHVIPKVAAGPPQHGMRVITIVGGVVFDEQASAASATARSKLVRLATGRMPILA